MGLSGCETVSDYNTLSSRKISTSVSYVPGYAIEYCSYRVKSMPGLLPLRKEGEGGSPASPLLQGRHGAWHRTHLREAVSAAGQQDHAASCPQLAPHLVAGRIEGKHPLAVSLKIHKIPNTSCRSTALDEAEVTTAAATAGEADKTASHWLFAAHALGTSTNSLSFI